MPKEPESTGAFDLQREFSIAANSKVPPHMRTKVEPNIKNIQLNRVTCPGSNRTPGEVYLENPEEEEKPRIKGFCVDHCGAGLTWSYETKLWFVGGKR